MRINDRQANALFAAQRFFIRKKTKWLFESIQDIKLVEVSVEYANEKFSDYNQTNELEAINVDGKWYVFQ